MGSIKKISPLSLKNLELGRVGRDKKRVSVTLLPETLVSLDATGNRSEAIDKAIAILKEYGLLELLPPSS